MAESFLWVAVLFVAALFLYFAPAIVATARGHRNTTAIFTLNLLLGWTLVGWVVALVWAFTNSAAVEAAPLVTQLEPLAVPVKSASAQEKVCPFCAETIKAAAVICKHCGREQPVLETVAGPQSALEDRATVLGIVWAPAAERFMWRGDFFKSLADAVAYAERNA